VDDRFFLIKMYIMKKLLVFFLIVAGSFTVNSAHSQVRVRAHVGIGTPPPVVVYERDYPGYTYYTYPSNTIVPFLSGSTGDTFMAGVLTTNGMNANAAGMAIKVTTAIKESPFI
jgi:hypothetical protein